MPLNRFSLHPKALIATLALFAAPVSLVAPTIPVLAQQAAPSTPQGELSQISRYLKSVQSLKADFTQTDRTGQMVSGTLTLKQPGKIRFEYQKDVNLLIVSDGRALTMIDYEVKQVQRWPIRNSPLGVLLDPSRDLSKYGKIVKTADPDVVSAEVRDPKRPEYGVITLVFLRKPNAPAGLELYGWVALDSQNKRTSIRLSNLNYNVPVADSAFAWKDPRGVRGPRR